jgi:alkylhydroperoxidase family enzyme
MGAPPRHGQHRMSDSRVPLLPAESGDADLARVFAAIRMATGRLLDLHRTVGHSPALLEAFANLALALRNSGQTTRTLRELVILRIAQLSESEYELAQHLPMARACGISEEQIRKLPGWRQDSKPLSADVCAALAYTEELYRNRVDDLTFETLRSYFSSAQIIELTLTASFYVMVALTTNALELSPETPRTCTAATESGPIP